MCRDGKGFDVFWKSKESKNFDAQVFSFNSPPSVTDGFRAYVPEGFENSVWVEAPPHLVDILPPVTPHVADLGQSGPKPAGQPQQTTNQIHEEQHSC